MTITKDLLPELTNEIPLKKDPICDGMKASYDEGLGLLENGIGDASDSINDMKDNLLDFEDFNLDTDNKVGAMDKMKDMLNEGMSVGSGECDPILNCLGTSFEDLFGFDPGKLFKDPSVDFSKYPNLIKDMVTGWVDDGLGYFLDSGEKALLDALKAVEDLFDTDLLDQLLAIAGCLAGHCDKPGDIPRELDIEQKMEDAGLKVTGEVDLGQTSLSDKEAKHFNKLRDSRRELDAVVNDKIKNIF